MNFLERMRENAFKRQLVKLKARNQKFEEWIFKVQGMHSRNNLRIIELKQKLGLAPLKPPLKPSLKVVWVAESNKEKGFMEEVEGGEIMPKHKEKKEKKSKRSY